VIRLKVLISIIIHKKIRIINRIISQQKKIKNQNQD